MTFIRRQRAMREAAAIGSGNSRAGATALVAGILGLTLVLAAPSALAADCKGSAEPGIDSDVARCVGDGLDLALDWGTYGGVPPDADVVATERVGGRDVTVTRDLDVLVVHFEAEPVDVGDGSVRPPPTLTLHVRCRTEAACETARQIVRTVRF